ncbi:MAG: LLM class flavin-dependent oxidoreductase [Acidimicrobiia bacterium]|nr:LLM class flavin-dependent oxidoreductase [Acidimicrobiia bacterium]
MDGNSRVGAIIPTSIAGPEDIAPAARFIEDAGFAEIWVAEDYFFYGGMSTAGLVLEATESIQVGLGIVASVARHPAVTAMEFATLDRAYPGRFLPGIGHGVPAWTKQMGLYPKSPLGVLREVATSVRRLVEGETLDESGNYTFNSVTLTHPSPGMKILGGVVGPKSLQMSGELMDGTVLSVLAGPRYVEYSIEHTSRGMAKAGRSGDHLLPTFALFAVDEDGDAARAAAKGVLAFYLFAVGPTPLTGVYDANPALIDMIQRGGPEAVAEEMPDEWFDQFAVVGTPAECTTKIEGLRAAGASSVVLFPVSPDQSRAQLEIASREILPNIGN